MPSNHLADLATPDDGVRRSSVELWDEAARPSGPPADPDRVYAAHERAAGQHLVEIHDHLRGELSRLRDVLAEVLEGRADPRAARSEIAAMSIRQNDWTLGAYCAQYCRLLTMHHGIEDASMFPHLRAADPALTPVVDRLEAEHRVIHDVLEGLDRALVGFVADPDGGPALEHAMDVLTDALLSHLSYEERELVEPLARLGVV